MEEGYCSVIGVGQIKLYVSVQQASEEHNRKRYVGKVEKPRRGPWDRRAFPGIERLGTEGGAAKWTQNGRVGKAPTTKGFGTQKERVQSLDQDQG